MATDKNFIVKNGLEVGGQEVISSSGVVTSTALGGQTLSTTDSPTFANTTLTGSLRGPATFTIDPAAVGDNTGTLVIAGNLQVDGTTTTVNSTTMEVDDLNITLASGAANAAAANGAGITVDGASATITYDGTNDQWDFNKSINVTGTGQATRLGLGVAPHATAGLNITTTNQHMRLNNGSELGIVHVLSTGELELWGHGDGESINFRTGSGAGTVAMNIVGNNVGITNTSTLNANLHIGSASATGDATNPALQIGGSSTYRLGMYTSTEGAVIANANGDDGIQFVVKTAGEAMRIDGGTGNVGIGTVSPAAKFSVDVGAPGSTDQTLGLFQSQDARRIGFVWDDSASTLGVATLTNHALTFHTNGNSSERMRINSSGNVMIGTTTASGTLNVEGSINWNGQLRPNANSNGGSETSPTVCVGYDNDTGLFHPATNNIGFTTAGTERMRIDSSGNTTFYGNLTIVDDIIHAGDPDTYLSFEGDSLWFYMGGQQNFKVTNTNVTALNLQLTDSSKLGFGTVKAGASVGHTASVNEGIFWHTTDGYGIYRTAGAWSGDYSQLRLDWTTGIILDGGSAYGKSGVRVIGDLIAGAGSGYPHSAAINSAYLHSTGDTSQPACRFVQTSNSNSYTVMRLRHESTTVGRYIEFRSDENVLTGLIQDVSGTMQYQSSSDSRLKENVETMSEGLTEVLAMNPVKFTWKDIVTENKTVDMEGAESRGFLAQELNEQYPWAVFEGGEDEKESPWSVDYGKLTPLLVKAIQEQQVLIEAQATTIADLTTRIETLEG